MPGNALAQTLHMKCWGWYWSILELGPTTLSNEDATRATQTPVPGLQPTHPHNLQTPSVQTSKLWADAHPAPRGPRPPVGRVDGGCHRAEPGKERAVCRGWPAPSSA
eukprot:6634089-Pyramimonas_sp.AAC.1